MIDDCFGNKTLLLYGKGENGSVWMYVETCCKAIDSIIHNGHVGEVYNIGGHNEMRKSDIANFICEELACFGQTKDARRLYYLCKRLQRL